MRLILFNTIHREKMWSSGVRLCLFYFVRYSNLMGWESGLKLFEFRFDFTISLMNCCVFYDGNILIGSNVFIVIL